MLPGRLDIIVSKFKIKEFLYQVIFYFFHVIKHVFLSHPRPKKGSISHSRQLKESGSVK